MTRPNLEGNPCQLCLQLALDLKIRAETVQPIPPFAPLGMDSKKCCHDCQAAWNVMKLGLVGKFSWDDKREVEAHFVMARIAVGNDRQEQLRMPGAPRGLVGMGYMRANKAGDLDAHHKWLDTYNWFDLRDDKEGP